MPQQTQSGAASGVPSIPTTKTTAVLVIETAKPGVTAQQIMAVIPAEIRATVKLYLDGKIQQWYSRGDGKGVIFLVRCQDRGRGTEPSWRPCLWLKGRVDRSRLHSTSGPLMALRALMSAVAQQQ